MVKCGLDEGGRGLKLCKIKSKDANMMLCHVAMFSDFVTNSYGSLSTTNESQFKTTRNPKLKMLGFLCNQTVNLEIDAQTPYCSLLKKEIT